MTISSLDIIVCLDACFTQKRRRSSKRDPPLHHPRTVFLPEAIVKATEARVEEARLKPRGSQSDRSKDEGQHEPGMRLSRAILDHCKSVFVAADELRQKASTQFFADTGLMALLCRHDRVLWLVNITSAGEKYFYALALLEEL